MRRLEIGPGTAPLAGYEGLDIIKRPGVQHVGPAHLPPFKDATFDEVYSSHCIEHVDWWLVAPTIAQWARILKPGGILEIHTVNAAPLMQAMLEWEATGECSRKPGTWKAELHRDHPFLSAQGRIMNYAKKGDGGAHLHRAILTPRYLRECMVDAGLIEIEAVDEPKGRHKHKSINMGLRARKPA
jgi:ubiquinone/menaquinone biosynthesis C-methylase UbiE